MMRIAIFNVFTLNTVAYDIMSNAVVPKKLGEFHFEKKKWKREIELGDSVKMETVKIKLSKDTSLIIYYDIEISVIDLHGSFHKIESQSSTSFLLPQNTKTKEIKATFGKGKITIFGEIHQFKSELSVKLGLSNQLRH